MIVYLDVLVGNYTWLYKRGKEFEYGHDCCHVSDIILPFTTALSKAWWCRGKLKEKTEVGWGVSDHEQSSLVTGTPTNVSGHYGVVKIFGNGVKIVWNEQNREGAMWKGWWAHMYIDMLKIGTKWEL